MSLNPETLREVGKALFGEQWQGPLAKALCVNDKTMRNWQHDDADIPLGVLDELRDVAQERLALIQRALDRLGDGGGFQTQVHANMRRPTPRDKS